MHAFWSLGSWSLLVLLAWHKTNLQWHALVLEFISSGVFLTMGGLKFGETLPQRRAHLSWIGVIL